MAKSKYAPLKKDHHVVRRCGYQVIERDHITKQVKGLYPQAMMLRENIKEAYLSVNWLEHCAGTKSERLKAIVKIHRNKAKSRISPESAVAVLNTGRIIDIGASHERRLGVLFTQTKDDPSYSRITGLPRDNSDELLIVCLVEEAYLDFMLVRDVDALP